VRWPARLLTGAVVATVAVAGADLVRRAGTSSVGGASPATAAAAQAIGVERGDIVATVGLDATIVANPHVTLDAPVIGTVRQRSLAVDALLAAGDELGAVGSLPISAPVAATFVRWLVADGASVPEGLPIAELSLPGFAAEAVAPPQVAYRIFSRRVAARGAINDGPGPFDCTVLMLPSEPALQAENDVTGGDGERFVCSLPVTVRAVSGVRATVVVESARATNVLTLPVESVSGTADAGEVDIVAADGSSTRRAVRLGITDGIVVEITSGLDDGDRVTKRAPLLTVAGRP
jgi:membrane fusion protein, macrolide-specific efflux system